MLKLKVFIIISIISTLSLPGLILSERLANQLQIYSPIHVYTKFIRSSTYSTALSDEFRHLYLNDLATAGLEVIVDRNINSGECAWYMELDRVLNAYAKRDEKSSSIYDLLIEFSLKWSNFRKECELDDKKAVPVCAIKAVWSAGARKRFSFKFVGFTCTQLEKTSVLVSPILE